jgi:hypothetical protein
MLTMASCVPNRVELNDQRHLVGDARVRVDLPLPAHIALAQLDCDVSRVVERAISVLALSTHVDGRGVALACVHHKMDHARAAGDLRLSWRRLNMILTKNMLIPIY